MKLYQLVAIGEMALMEGSHKFHSKRVFYTMQDAEVNAPQFIESVTNSKSKCDMFILKPGTVEIKYVELELDEPALMAVGK